MALNKRILIIGAGITGLSLAYWLKNKNYTVVLAEVGSRAGGVIDTQQRDGFELDLGPVTCALNPVLEQLIVELKLTDKLLIPAPSKRFIYTNKRIHVVEPSVPKLLFHPMFSWKGRLRLLKDLFVKPSAQSSNDESVSSFATRHFGKEAAEKLFDPVLNGIYAGNYEALSIRSVLPLLPELEQAHGSVIKGLIKNQKQFSQKRIITSMQGSFRTLIDTLVKACQTDIRLNCSVQKLTKQGNGYDATLNQLNNHSTEYFDEVFVTTPAYATAGLIEPFNTSLSAALKTVPYSSLQQIYCAVDSPTSFNGFGFLVPSAERLSLLGAIHVSHLFPTKSPSGKSLFILFCGGRRPYPFEASTEKCIAEFSAILNVKVEVLHIQQWTKAIPQPNVGHRQIIGMIENFEKLNPTLHIAGSFRGGVAVGDRIKFSKELADAC